ncbi:hypothetical protein KL906_002071 [Ogataea polymorpha]|nr:hypothetical protein KL906_002071 [Ogataea polymorpha]
MSNLMNKLSDKLSGNHHDQQGDDYDDFQSSGSRGGSNYSQTGQRGGSGGYDQYGSQGGQSGRGGQQNYGENYSGSGGDSNFSDEYDNQLNERVRNKMGDEYTNDEWSGNRHAQGFDSSGVKTKDQKW